MEMTVLYVASWEATTGKTTLCVGIGKRLQKGGRTVGYLKPLAFSQKGASSVDKEAQFVKQALALGEPEETLCPLKATPDVLVKEVKSDKFTGWIKNACSEAAAGKDVLLLEGCGGLEEKSALNEAFYRIAETVDAKVLLVVRYVKDLTCGKIAPARKGFGKRLLGVVINQVPSAKVEAVQRDLTATFGAEGITILGVLPEERQLLGISIADLVEQIDAKVLCCSESLPKLVENVMVGAMTVDSGADYFSRKDKKLVIARGDRADVHAAALTTSTQGLVLTGGIAPTPKVIYWAEENSVPILLTEQDTLSTIDGVDQAISEARFRHLTKSERLDSIMAKNFDFETLHQSLELATTSSTRG